MLTNACFLALNHTDGLVSVEESTNSKSLKVITSENKAVIMLDDYGKRSKEFDMDEAEPSCQIAHCLPIPVAANIP